jgi:hypothetical protein
MSAIECLLSGVDKMQDSYQGPPLIRPLEPEAIPTERDDVFSGRNNFLPLGSMILRCLGIFSGKRSLGRAGIPGIFIVS